MKKLVFSLALAIVLINLASACINSADDYAVELEMANITYSLANLVNFENIIHQQNYIMQSQYSKNLASILTETQCENKTCLNLRLQMPVETKTIKIPYFSFTSSIYKKVGLQKTNYKDWTINSNENSIEVKKPGLSILATILPIKTDFIVEINKNIKECEVCDGKCLYSLIGNFCITKEIKDELNETAIILGLNSEDIFYSYKIIGKGDKTITDLSPISEETNFREALKQELVFLKTHKTINLSNEDIEKITDLAEKGKAGDSKIIKSGKWKYYYETTNKKNDILCREFSASLIPISKPKLIITNEKQIYYAIPILLTLFLFLVLIILLILGRIMSQTKKKARKEK